MKNIKDLITEKKNAYGYDEDKLHSLMGKVIDILKNDSNDPDSSKAFWDIMNDLLEYWGEDDFKAALKGFLTKFGIKISVR